MERTDDRSDDPGRSGFDSLADATGIEESADRSAMDAQHDVSEPEAEDAPTGDEETAIEGAAGLAASHRAWGGMPTDIEGGAGTHVPAEGDEHMPSTPDERKDSSDPRGY